MRSLRIGWRVAPRHAGVAAEVFEMLKVPAEPYRDGQPYAAVVSDGEAPPAVGGRALQVESQVFATALRMFGEGQPESEAASPVLDLEVASLRESLSQAFPLVEVPARPLGHDLVVTLSHDIDHVSLRELGFGEQWLGFLLHSTWWPLRAWLGGRIQTSDALRALRLAVTSPLILAGLARDPWAAIDEYLAVEREQDAASTFFFIPFRDHPGLPLAGNGGHHRRRAARYDLTEQGPLIERILAAGGEAALHGLDAWHDLESARGERERVASVAGVPPAGVRMHYLYFGDRSAELLDRAGFAYDSSVGYPRRTGFRAGTLHPYRPPGAKRMLELPVHVEDGSLLGAHAENLDRTGAEARIHDFLDLAERFGGALNVSWHDVSLEQPRNWRATYLRLLSDAKERGAWLTTLGTASAWFRLRREVRLKVEFGPADALIVTVDVPAPWPRGLPKLRLRVHMPVGVGQSRHVDVPLVEGRQTLTLSHGRAAVQPA